MIKKYCKKITTILLIVLLIGMAAFMSGCETYDAFMEEFVLVDEEPEETVRIGVFEPLSGKDKHFGELEKKGIELARELFPSALNKQVELIYADNQSDIYVAESAIQELISKRPAVILGSYGDVYTLIAAKYVEKAEIPAIAITNTNPLVTGHNPYYFRVCFVETYQGIALAKFTVEELGVNSAAILRQKSDDTAIAMSQSFGDKMRQMTEDENAVKLTLEFTPGQESFETEILRLKSTQIPVVFLPVSVIDAVKILIEAEKQDYDAVFLGTEELLNDDFLARVGDAAELVAISSVYDPDTQINDMSETFLNAYKKKYGKDAVPEPEVALGFDAYIIAIDSLNRIGTALDGKLMANSIALETSFPGASGNITFDSNGDPMKSVVIKGVKNGEFISLYTMEPIFE